MELEQESSVSMSGLTLNTRRRWLSDWVELVSSMRFAISLFAMIAIASVIGTIMQQNDQTPNYINKFGPFWYEVFVRAKLDGVYSAWWYLGFLIVLLVSTSLCIVRNAPKMLRDMRSWREQVREQSLRNFHHQHEWLSALQPAALAKQTEARLKSIGYKIKLVQKEQATLVSAKNGAANKWGYILAHGAIVVIGIGAMLDSDLSIRAQEWFGGKMPYNGSNTLISEIPEKHRLSPITPTFRGNMQISEGSSSDVAIIQHGNGVYIEDLPFTLKLKKFDIEFYSRGMPKLFASHVVLTDKATGKSQEAVIKVNEPLIHDGHAIYQSSFEDGGSHLKLKAYPMKGAAAQSSLVDGQVGASAAWGDDYTVEYTGFRVFNVENTNQDDTQKAGKQSLSEMLNKHLGSAGKNAENKDLKNVGPSLQYKLRDKTGQAREFNNYMQSVMLDGSYVFLAGVRDAGDEAFRYLRIPADDNDSPDEWFRIRAALLDPALRAKAAERYAQRQLAEDKKLTPEFRAAFVSSAEKGMSIFAGDDKVSGYIAVSKMLDKFPEADREKNADIFMKILNGGMWELWQVAREKDGLPPVEADEKHGRFLQLATNAYADAFFYSAPMYMHLESFEQVQASVFQVTRSPGKSVVYFGCLLLVAGVFSMLFVRERRIWVWIRHDPDGAHALMAMSTQRKTLDFELEFERIKKILPATSAEPHTHSPV